MKLRIKGNSIRIRLTKTEVDRFEKDHYLKESTEFVTGKLTYVLAKDPAMTELGAKIEGTKITVQVPPAVADRWTSTDEVGFQNNFTIGADKQLFLLVEKDFVCLDNTLEDQSDNYPNPNAVC
ncbi:MAG: hypothetical protein V4658_05910 [Bacteroidota bacterium]